MPFMQIFTTLSRSQVPANLGQQAAIALSKTLHNKPLNRICVHVATDQMIFTGSQAEAGSSNTPTAYAIIRSIGSVGLEDNRKTVAAITKLLQEQLNIPRAEIRLFFHDFKPEMFGVNGVVFKDGQSGTADSGPSPLTFAQQIEGV